MRLKLVHIALGFCIFSVIGLFFSTQLYLFIQQGNSGEGWGEAIHSSLANWYTWALLAFVVIVLARQFPIEKMHWLRRLLFHTVCALLLALLHTALVVSWYWLVRSATQSWSSWKIAFGNGFMFYFHWDVMIYFTILGFVWANDYSQRLLHREVRDSQLEAKLHRAQLDALRIQLNPHFLFNSLNAVSELVHENPMAADKAVSQLAGLLRNLLDDADKYETTVREELEFNMKYLDIEKIRFGNRLAVQVSIDENILDVPIPSLVLQPLVENAIRHGISTREEGGFVELRGYRNQDKLVLQVRNSGHKASTTRKANHAKGVGLSNLRARLECHYGTNYKLEISHQGELDFTVLITIPFPVMYVTHE